MVEFVWLYHAGQKHPGAEFLFTSAIQSYVLLKNDQGISRDLLSNEITGIIQPLPLPEMPVKCNKIAVIFGIVFF